MPDRNKVIAIAIAETGYLEKSKSAYQKNPDIINDTSEKILLRKMVRELHRKWGKWRTAFVKNT